MSWPVSRTMLFKHYRFPFYLYRKNEIDINIYNRGFSSGSLQREKSIKNSFGPLHRVRWPTQVQRVSFSSLKPTIGSTPATVSSELKTIDFDIASRVDGQESQVLTVELEPGQLLRAETGCMLYMTEGVEVEANMGGGISSALSRLMTGQNLMVSDFKYTGPEGTTGKVALGPDYPAKILKVNLKECGGGLICQKGAFMAGSHTIDIQMQPTKTLTAGFFGGEGFILQKLTGEGDAFIKGGGLLIRKTLQPGEVLKIQSGALVAFTPEVQYDIATLKGIKNMFFGEGLIVTTLTGPGTVWIQGLPFDKMVESVASRIPSRGGIGFGLPIPIGGGGGGGTGAGTEGGDVGAVGTAAEVGNIPQDAAEVGQAPAGAEGLFGDAVKPEEMISLDDNTEGNAKKAGTEEMMMQEEDFKWGAQDSQSSPSGSPFQEEFTKEAVNENSGSIFKDIFDFFKDNSEN